MMHKGCAVLKGILGLMALLIAGNAWCAASITTNVVSPKTVEIFSLVEQGEGKSLGKISFADSKDGLVITPDLKGLTSGEHGMHIHENPNCGILEDGKKVLGSAAGGHFDPEHTGEHKGPHHDGKGHAGDLPVLVVDKEGVAKATILAPKLKVEQINNRSIIIHANGDNFADLPEKLGGSGPRVACGVIKF